MGKFELKLPKMGESVAEATLTSWLKDIGDSIDMDEAVVEIATDKVDSEVPSEYKGTLLEKCFKIDEVIKVGETIAIIETDAEIQTSQEIIEVNQKDNSTNQTNKVIAENTTPIQEKETVIKDISISKKESFDNRF